ncbi:MAG: hypothetical protein QW478_08495 [Candidatus Micrarchaeaceae archaeon]
MKKFIKNGVQTELIQGNEIGKTINNTIPYIKDFTDTSNQIKFNENNQIKDKDKLLLDLSSRLPKFCSKFDSCNAPLCPLDPLIDERYADKDDDRCTMSKATCHGYWVKMPPEFQQYLPYQGYFKSEYNRIEEGKKRWSNLSQEEKDKIIARGREVLKRRFER